MWFMCCCLCWRSFHIWVWVIIKYHINNPKHPRAAVLLSSCWWSCGSTYKLRNTAVILKEHRAADHNQRSVSINHIYLNVSGHVINQQDVRRSEVNQLWASVTWTRLIRHGSEPQSETVCVWNKDDLWHDESDVSLLLICVTTICKINLF